MRVPPQVFDLHDSVAEKAFFIIISVVIITIITISIYLELLHSNMHPGTAAQRTNMDPGTLEINETFFRKIRFKTCVIFPVVL